jgi:hypothetical protein
MIDAVAWLKIKLGDEVVAFSYVNALRPTHMSIRALYRAALTLNIVRWRDRRKGIVWALPIPCDHCQGRATLMTSTGPPTSRWFYRSSCYPSKAGVWPPSYRGTGPFPTRYQNYTFEEIARRMRAQRGAPYVWVERSKRGLADKQSTPT